MDDATRTGSLSLEIEDIRLAVADEEFRAYTRPYNSTLFGTVYLCADGAEITHTNKLPAEFDLIDSIRAQYELVEPLEQTGEAKGPPFCCVCGDRGCAYISWSVTDEPTDQVSIALENLLQEPIGQSPYRMPKQALYAGFDEFWTTVLEFCGARDIERFDWGDRVDSPVSGREAYATTAELQSWRTTLRERLDA